jgi:hypothetical protein
LAIAVKNERGRVRFASFRPVDRFRADMVSWDSDRGKTDLAQSRIALALRPTGIEATVNECQLGYANRRSRKRRHASPLLWAFLVLGVECFGAGLAFGASSETNQPTLSPFELGYSVKHWTMKDGPSVRIVTSLARTPDGFLWGGTRQGLFRFDGTQFRNFSADEIPALHNIQILEMRCDAMGRLWICGVTGELVLYENGVFRRKEISVAEWYAPVIGA